jgi:hypothetical protein
MANNHISSSETNPLQLKINYLTHTELNLVYLLLKQTLKDDKNIGFNLKDVGIGNFWFDNDNEKHLKQLQKDMTE